MMKVENETDANNNNLYDINNNATVSASTASGASGLSKSAQMMGSTDSLANNNVSNNLENDEFNQSDDNGRTNLIVNYLPQNMTQDEIKSLFSSIGPVDTCKLIKDKLTGQSLGYAFVKYANQDDADKAVNKLNSMRLQNKTIKVSHARPSSEQIKGANLYVCGLTKEFTQEELEKLFNQFGVIISSKILTDPKTGESKGVGFVRFDKRGEAENAIAQLNGKIIENLTEPLVVKFANSPTSVKSVMGLPLAPFACRGFYQPYRPAANGSYRYSPINSAMSGAAFPPPLDLIHATPVGAPTHMVSAAAAAAAAASLSGLIHPGATGVGSLPTTPVGAALQGTLLTTASAAATALGSPGAPNGAPVMASPPPPQQSNSTSLNTSSSLNSLTFPGYPIFVYNLGPESDENTLWQLFGPFGAVQSVKIVRDMHTHKCKGFGFVTMTNYDEAVTAIGCLNGFVLHNRILQVSFKNSVPPMGGMPIGAGGKQPVQPQLQPLF